MPSVDQQTLRFYTTCNRRPRRSAVRLQADGVLHLLLFVSLFIVPIDSIGLTKPASAAPLPAPGSNLALVQPSPTPETAASAHPDCTETHGQIEQGEIEVNGQPRPLPFRVYLPPCYNDDAGQRYPVLYLLHGLLGTDAQWDDLGADEAADELITQGAMPPFLIVMPWERNGLTIESALVDGLVEYIDQNYRTRPQAIWRAIGGLSRGGGQALDIGLRHPDLFGQISLHSPAILHGDPLILSWLKGIPVESLPAIWIDIGLRDSLFPSTAHLIEFLFQQDIAPTLQFNEGDHLPAYWESNLPTYLRWHGGLWQAAQLEQCAEVLGY